MKRMLTQLPWDEKAGKPECISSLPSNEEKLPERQQWPGGQRRRDKRRNRIKKYQQIPPASTSEPSLMGSLLSVTPEDRLRPRRTRPRISCHPVASQRAFRSLLT